MKRIAFAIFLCGALLALPAAAQTAAPSDVSTIIGQFRTATLPWLNVGEQVATSLFGYLALAEFAIAAGMLALAQADITVWTATLVRKVLVVGAFYALLLFGPTWMQSVIDSFTQFGSMASGIPSIAAGDILADGIDIVSTLLISAIGAGITMSFVSSIFMVVAAAVVMWAYIVLVKAFVIAKIEAYITIYAGVIQLGWGGNRFTSTYAERYIAGAFATGIKLMVFYLIIGVGRALAPGWLNTASQVTVADSGVIPTVTMVASIVIFCSLANIDKWAAALFAGTPQFSGHDITNTYLPIINTALTAAGFGTGMATSGMNAGISVGAGAAGSAGQAAGSRGASAVMRSIGAVTSGASQSQARPQSAPPQISAAPIRGYLPPPSKE